MELDHVVEAFAEFIDFIGGQVLIGRLPREPELHITHLLKAHHLAQPRYVRLRRRRAVCGRRESSASRTEQRREVLAA
jgi:hypothetical protein